MTGPTLPQLLLQNVARHGNRRIALRKKTNGIWQSFTWQDYLTHVKSLSLGLISLGLKRGEKVAIIGDNDPEWYFAELAAQSAGAASVGIYPDGTAAEMAFLIEHCDATIAIVRDQEQVDKLLEVSDKLPLLNTIVYWYPKGLWQYSETHVISITEVQRLGEAYEHQHPGSFDKSVEQGRGDDIAILSYTSGTSGVPKGVILTHDNLTDVVGHGIKSGLLPLNESDVWLSYTSPAWVTDQYWGILASLMGGVVVGFAEKPETVQQDLRELAPTFFVAGPTYWERIASETLARITDAGAPNRACYRLALAIGTKSADRQYAGRSINPIWRALSALATLAVFRPLKDRFGLSKLRLAYVVGAPAGRELMRFFHAWGINLRRVYGTTEAGTISMQPEDRVSDETVGFTFPGRQVVISEVGEILVKMDSLGYYKNPEATSQKIRDGWFHTGDAGYITESGELVFLDRLDDLVDLGNGAKFAPQYVESMLRFSPYVAEAVAIGGSHVPFVTLLAVVDYENTSKWAEKRGVVFATYTDLSQKPEVQKLVLTEVQRVNAALPERSRIKRFVILHKVLDPDDQELTRTRKLRRKLLEDRYRVLLDAMYGGCHEVLVESEITYADGKKGKTAAKVGIVDVSGVSA